MGDSGSSKQLYTHLIGQFVTVRVQSGTQYTGVFHGVKETPSTADFILRMAKDADDVLMLPIDEKVIPWDDFVELSAVHVETHLRNSAFQIDSEISGAELQERELTAWDDGDATAEDLGLLSSLDGDLGDDWDQFAVRFIPDYAQLQVNKNKFGVKTTYDEEKYTTKLDKDSAFYKERIQHATKLAQDIQKQSTKNIHLLEERTGEILTDTDVDEESKYSSVIREGEGVTRYIPPFRRGQENQDTKQPIEGKIATIISTGSRNSSPSRRQQQQPKSVDALGLEHTAPVVSEVAEKFVASQHTPSEKQSEIQKFKRFSADIDKKITPTSSPKQERKPSKGGDASQAKEDLKSSGPSSASLKKLTLDPNAREFTPGSFGKFTPPSPVPTPTVVGVVPAMPYPYMPVAPYVTAGYMAPAVTPQGRPRVTGAVPYRGQPVPVAPYMPIPQAGLVPMGMGMMGMGMVGLAPPEAGPENTESSEPEKPKETKPAGLKPPSFEFVPGGSFAFSSMGRGTK